LLRRIVTLIFIALLLIPAAASGQEGITLSELQIDLWPEFDRPTMLAIYKGTLSPNVSLPANLTFRIPAATGEPNAVALRQVDGNLFSVDYNRQVNGEWSLISFTATMPQFQLEYYDPSLVKENNQRHYEYRWLGDYAIDQLIVRVQQPAGATDMRISPNMGSGLTGDDGLIYFSTDIGSISQGDGFTISLDYQKEGDALTSGNLQVEPSAPINSSAPGRIDLTSTLPWALGILGLLLIAGGGWWYWQSGREEVTEPKRRRRRVAAGPSQPTTQTSDGAIYCHQCGKRAEPSDRFCRACGTRLRTE
jgi:hypothetical protein